MATAAGAVMLRYEHDQRALSWRIAGTHGAPSARVLEDETRRSLEREVEELRQRERQLVEAIHSRDAIGQAKGILMERMRVDAQAAFEILRSRSQETNQKLIDVAEHLALTGELLERAPTTATGPAAPQAERRRGAPRTTGRRQRR